MGRGSVLGQCPHAPGPPGTAGSQEPEAFAPGFLRVQLRRQLRHRRRLLPGRQGGPPRRRGGARCRVALDMAQHLLEAALLLPEIVLHAAASGAKGTLLEGIARLGPSPATALHPSARLHPCAPPTSPWGAQPPAHPQGAQPPAPPQGTSLGSSAPCTSPGHVPGEFSPAALPRLLHGDGVRGRGPAWLRRLSSRGWRR